MIKELILSTEKFWSSFDYFLKSFKIIHLIRRAIFKLFDAIIFEHLLKCEDISCYSEFEDPPHISIS